MRVRQGLRPALLGLALALALIPARFAAAETCTADSFGDAVDASAAELRAFSAETQPKLRQKLQALRDHKKWSDADYEAQGLALVHDKKLDQFDAEASDLLSRIDTLGTPEQTDAETATSCANLTELKAASSELMAVMRAKSAYLIAKIENEIASSPASAAPQEVAKAEPPAAAESAPELPAFAPAQPITPPAAGAEPQPSLSPIRRTEKPKSEPLAPVAPAPPS